MIGIVDCFTIVARIALAIGGAGIGMELSARAQPPPPKEWQDTRGFTGAFEYMRAVLTSCGERRMAELCGEAIMEKMDHSPSSNAAKRRAHSLANGSALKINSEARRYINGHGRLPEEPDGHGGTMCHSLRHNERFAALRDALERYDQGKVGAEAIVEGACKEGPFIGP